MTVHNVYGIRATLNAIKFSTTKRNANGSGTTRKRTIATTPPLPSMTKTITTPTTPTMIIIIKKKLYLISFSRWHTKKELKRHDTTKIWKNNSIEQQAKEMHGKLSSKWTSASFLFLFFSFRTQQMTNEIFINYFVLSNVHFNWTCSLRMKIAWADKIPLIIDGC